MQFVFSRRQAQHFRQAGVDMWVYYQGKMKQILVVAPAWEPKYEQIIRQL